MDRADQPQGALPGEESQPQADSPPLAEAPELTNSTVEQSPTDAVPLHAEGPTADLATDFTTDTSTAGTKEVLDESGTPATEPTWEAGTASVEPALPEEALAEHPVAESAFTAQSPLAAESVVAGEPSIGAEAAVAAASAAVEPPDEAQPVEGQAAAVVGQSAEQTAEAPTAEMPAEEKSKNMQWYVLKVQSNREETIREALLKRVKIAGLEKYFGEIIIPTEKVTEVKGGKKKVVTRKLYPGYLVAQMEINDDTWYLVRDTSGVGDFTGAAGRPSPMPEHEVARILAKHEEKSQKQPKLKIAFKPGDQVKIHEGTFENFEGQVESIDETNGRVTVMINIFGRSTPVELEYWQIGAV